MRRVLPLLSMSIGLQAVLAFFPVGQVGMEKELEKATVIGREKMNQFMDNHIFAQLFGHAEQFRV